MGSISAVLLYSYIGYLSMILPITIILIAALFYHQMGKLYTQILRLVRLKLIQNQRKNAAQSLIIPNYPLKTCQNRLACFKDLSYLVICPNLALVLPTVMMINSSGLIRKFSAVLTLFIVALSKRLSVWLRWSLDNRQQITHQ